MNLNLLCKVLSETLVNFPEVSLVYLFGSQTMGNLGPMSDVDLGVLLDHGVQVEPLRTRLAHKMLANLKVGKVDVVSLADAPIELAYAVIDQGILLYQRDLVTRVEFEATVMNRYGDYLPVLRSFREQILKGDTHGTRVQRYRAALRRTERTLSQIRTIQKQEA